MQLESFFRNSVGVALLSLQQVQSCQSAKLCFSAPGRKDANFTLSRYDAECPAIHPQYRIGTTDGPFEIIDDTGTDILNKTKDLLLVLFKDCQKVEVKLLLTYENAAPDQIEGDSASGQVMF